MIATPVPSILYISKYTPVAVTSLTEAMNNSEVAGSLPKSWQMSKCFFSTSSGTMVLNMNDPCGVHLPPPTMVAWIIILSPGWTPSRKMRHVRFATGNHWALRRELLFHPSYPSFKKGPVGVPFAIASCGCRASFVHPIETVRRLPNLLQRLFLMKQNLLISVPHFHSP